MKEEYSSLDVENIDKDRVGIFRKIRQSPIVKRVAITTSRGTKKYLKTLKDGNRRNSVNTPSTQDLNHSFNRPSP